MCIWLTFYFPVSSAQRREKKLNKGTSSTSICKQGSWERSQLEISLPPGTKVEQQGSESWGTVIYILYLSQKPSPCISIHTHIYSVCVNSLVLWPLKHAYSHPSWLRYRRSVTFALCMILHHGETKAILTFCHKISCALLIGHCTDASISRALCSQLLERLHRLIYLFIFPTEELHRELELYSSWERAINHHRRLKTASICLVMYGTFTGVFALDPHTSCLMLRGEEKAQPDVHPANLWT